jgi:predicted Zn-dependent peptidase
VQSLPRVQKGLGLQRAMGTLPGYLATASAVNTKKMPNGVTVATEAGAGDLAIVSVWIDSGSRNEAANVSGASNLITRVALKVRSMNPARCTARRSISLDEWP